MKVCSALGWLMLGAAFAAPAQALASHGEASDIGKQSITAIIEISAGGDVKYERDAEGRIVVDRFLSQPVVYPANYGSLADTLAGDGDPLDVLVYARRPIMIGARIAVRPVGVLRMVDDGKADEKIIAVPVSSVDPAYDAVQSVADLGYGEGERLIAFFRQYKQDANGKSQVALSGLGDAREASALTRQAQAEAARRDPNKKVIR